MGLPPHFRSLPRASYSTREFDELLVRTPMGAAIDYDICLPKWQFLDYACNGADYLAHGSGDPNIELFEPRKAQDIASFGDQRAVYAASDGVWAMYFAIVNREATKLLMNACVRAVDSGNRGEPHYFFSIDAESSGASPWRSGFVYLLPRESFRQQTAVEDHGVQIEIAQWASHEPVRPVAKLAVGPEDFPLLEQVFRHDPEVVLARAKENPDGFPWLDS